MAKQTGKKREYTVGKGKPPKEHQFKTGNKAAVGHGRPRSFNELRALVKDIAAEQLQGADLTRVEAMILSMASSRNANDKRLFLEYGYGKVPDKLEIDDGKWKKYHDALDKFIHARESDSQGESKDEESK